MTRKDYISIAAAIRTLRHALPTSNAAITRLVADLCVIFRKDNPSFNPFKFTYATYDEAHELHRSAHRKE